eukprot:CAMPEP_0119347558 /NCGR_PEP_ID=MMETSP1333-20130426/108586_1 /TAXON_ID=418940 /ORGANISM="Scyphosphaera apsteinii, Strain RCC1455" /LENGTH=382 /DNA_ID=CAMNT_0007360107 /DNA_START=94 /DNA_END=1240 /DNA_ORIENTATION=+
MELGTSRCRNRGRAQQPVQYVSRRLDRGILRRKVRVLWEAEGFWFAGTVQDFSPVTEMHLVLYDDNDIKWHRLNDPACLWFFEEAVPEEIPLHCKRTGTLLRSTPKAVNQTARAANTSNGATISSDSTYTNTKVLATMAEGLQLHMAPTSATGYRCVTASGEGRFRVQCHMGGKAVHLGTFGSAVEAGPVQVQCHMGGKAVHLGTFGSAVEAAVCYARHVQTEQGGQVDLEDKNIFQVERLLSQRTIRLKGRPRRQFLVRWLGYGPAEDTWEDEANIHDRSLICEFELKQPPHEAGIKLEKAAEEDARVADEASVEDAYEQQTSDHGVALEHEGEQGIADHENRAESDQHEQGEQAEQGERGEQQLLGEAEGLQLHLAPGTS